MKHYFSASVTFCGLILLLVSTGCEQREAEQDGPAPPQATDTSRIQPHADKEGNAASASSEPARTVALKVDGMHCTGCASALMTQLSHVPGVVMADVSFQDGEARIGVTEAGPDAAKLIEQITTVNPTYTAEPISEEVEDASSESTPAGGNGGLESDTDAS